MGMIIDSCIGTADFRLSTMTCWGTPPKAANAFSWQDRKNSDFIAAFAPA